jgi:hypothetical protein
MRRRTGRALIGCVMSGICLVSCFAWVGITVVTDSTDSTGRLWATHRHAIGISRGIFFTHWNSTSVIVWNDMKSPSLSVRRRTTFFDSNTPGSLDYTWSGITSTIPGTRGYESRGRWNEGGQFSFPIWPLCLLALPWALRRLREYRNRPFEDGPPHCRVCGYDLRASPERCPECGTPITAI